ncbi:nuclear transport factor 2 family protein [Streptomyces sp. NPDC008238]
MSHASPVDTVREFYANFGPSFDDAAATCLRLLHPDVTWHSVIFNDHPVDGPDALLGDLRRALETFRASGLRTEVRHIRADGDTVCVRRTDTLLDDRGEPMESYDVVSTVRLQDGMIRSTRDRFADARASRSV